MGVAAVAMDSDAEKKGGLPWHWLIFLPVLASVVAGLTTLAIAIKHGDKPLPETVTRTGPVQYGEHIGVTQARERGIQGQAVIDPASHGLVLNLSGKDLPQTLILRLWHPTETSRDLMLPLTRGDDGSYRGVWPDGAGELTPLLTAPDQGWELPGSVDPANGLALVFKP